MGIISIHALVKRATFRQGIFVCKTIISIHALVKRATLSNSFLRFQGFYFNPRPREEGDALLTKCRFSVLHFNPRPREEGDAIDCKAVSHSAEYFNPRPREEGD